MAEFILRNNYPGLFEVERPCAIALEKLNMLITNMIDPNILYSRFSFFESEIQAVNKKFAVSWKTRYYRINLFRNILMRPNSDQRGFMEQILILICISHALKVILWEISGIRKILLRVTNCIKNLLKTLQRKMTKQRKGRKWKRIMNKKMVILVWIKSMSIKVIKSKCSR